MAKKFDINAQKGHQAMANQNMGMMAFGTFGGMPRQPQMFGYQQQHMMPMMRPMNPMMLIAQPPNMVNPMQQSVIMPNQMNQSTNYQPQNSNLGYQNNQNRQSYPVQNQMPNQFQQQNNFQNPQNGVYQNQPIHVQPNLMPQNNVMNMGYGGINQQRPMQQQQPGYIYQQPFQQPFNPFGFR
jgi:hypothetical protein